MILITAKLGAALEALTAVDPKNVSQVADCLRTLVVALDGTKPLDVQTVRTTTIQLLMEHQVPDARRLVAAAFAERVGHTDTPAPAPAIAADALRTQGASVLEAPNILELVGAAAAASGYAGDVRAPKVIYLALTSRILERPVNLAITGPSAAGKNFAVRVVLPAFPRDAYHEVTGASPLALIYNKASFAHRAVIVGESSALHTEGIGASLLRGLAWDQQLVYETVIDREHVRLEKEGPTSLITTSTGDLDDQLATRLWMVPIADTPAQTRAVLQATGRHAAGRRSAQEDWSAFVAAQAWLAAAGVHRVTVPFAEALAELLPDHEVRLRRDFPQLLALVQAHALLHQHHRDRDGDGRVVARLVDYGAVSELVGPIFAASVSAGATREIRETVAAVQHLTAGITGSTVNITQVAEALKLSSSGAWLRVRQALKHRWLVNDETRKGQHAKLRLGEPLPHTCGLPGVEEVGERAALRDDGAPAPDSPKRSNDSPKQ
jgi:hypothetical protein